MAEMMKMLMSDLVREDKLDGRDYLVAPVVLITEGVHNNILYRAEDLKKFPEAWDGRPIPLLHPEQRGKPISANSPEILESRIIGNIYRTKYDEWDSNGRKLKGLKSEAWIDVAKCKKIAPKLLKALRDGENIEVSTGLFTEDLDERGEWNQESYAAIATNYRPDHLAVLPGLKGACSWEDGAGMPRVNAKDEPISMDERLSKIRVKVSDAMFGKPGAAVPVSGYVAELFDSYAIVEREGKTWRVPYSMDGDEVVVDKAGAEEVERRTVYKLKANIAPAKGEKRDDFIQRFMSDEKMVGEYEDEKQRYAVALSHWKGNAGLPDEDEVKALLPEGATLVRFGSTSVVYLGKDGVKGSFKYVRDDEGGLVKANHSWGGPITVVLGRIDGLMQRLKALGGPGSGNFGHGGRPGQVGGSSGGGGGGGSSDEGDDESVDSKYQGFEEVQDILEEHSMDPTSESGFYAHGGSWVSDKDVADDMIQAMELGKDDNDVEVAKLIEARFGQSVKSALEDESGAYNSKREWVSIGDRAKAVIESYEMTSSDRFEVERFPLKSLQRIRSLQRRLKALGGPGSGNFGHGGRPGEVGGSSGGGGGGGKIGSTVSFRTPKGWTRRGKIVADLGNRVRIETPEGDRSNVLKSDLLSPGKSQLVSVKQSIVDKLTNQAFDDGDTSIKSGYVEDVLMEDDDFFQEAQQAAADKLGMDLTSVSDAGGAEYNKLMKEADKIFSQTQKDIVSEVNRRLKADRKSASNVLNKK